MSMLSMTNGISGFGQFVDDVVAVVVRAVEDAEVGPFALRLFLRVADDRRPGRGPPRLCW